ncbi:MAG: hypothetical protein HRU48_21750 [Vibrio sp.]|uniref:hypothetical protein n=1 Tax=Vibrio TaxID=662 RepID=UPI001EC650D5|nr:hypothetical protein [Vibrio sp.]NRB69947.1 hypothetical protein [Vibrio sp.]
MASRRELGSIASGIIGSFCSRNNDVDGYWAVGKLYKHVVLLEPKVFSIDLLSQTIEPYDPCFELMVKQYFEMLQKLVAKRGLRPNWLRAVRVKIQFEVAYEHCHHHWRGALGNPCRMECIIEDDLGKRHIALSYANCYPHDPSKETRSSRVASS